VTEEPAQTRTHTLTVARDKTRTRLDSYLCIRLPQYSRTFFQKLIKAGAVLVDEQRAKASQMVSLGQKLSVELPAEEEHELEPEDIALDIIYEDDLFIVINKQPGLAVHPARKNQGGTLVNALLHHADKLSNAASAVRPGILHRLDKDTTGVMMVAKDDRAHRFLARQFENRSIQKTYLALVTGQPRFDEGLINKPIGRSLSQREKMKIAWDEGKAAFTKYEVVERFRGFALVKCMPKTGRTHQIRVHLASIKHPVLFDQMYGGAFVTEADIKGFTETPGDTEQVMSHHALHAYSLRFFYPFTTRTVEYTVEPPRDFARMLGLLREYRREDD